MYLLYLIAFGAALAAPAELPEIGISRDDTRIRESCRLKITPDAILRDENHNGFIHVAADNIVIELPARQPWRGSPTGTPPDQYTGYAVRIDGHDNVTVRGGRISGYHAAVWATGANGLTLERIDASDNRRDRLRSTPAAEDTRDWLFPHQNDENEWLERYGAAFYIEDAERVTVRACRVRQGQNALCLDRVTHGRIHDNDFSFNSGWGIALWRSSDNVITRNACDFCVRGYSHGVYNRGQDSAGILLFEQCSRNIVAENSATHGGDGFFGFAGKEALGQTPPPTEGFNYERRGCNDNLLAENDFSYAPAHGIELTFSFGNRFQNNRLVGNAICGVWGGYSQDTLIAGNDVRENGDAGYGDERGGVNIEHGRGNRILHNEFHRNACGVHFWWDEDREIAQTPWAKANGTATTDNLVAANTFDGDEIAVHLRGDSSITFSGNTIKDVPVPTKIEPQAELRVPPALRVAPPPEPEYPVLGERKPVGARAALAGRANIIMTEWGPWDHEAPLLRPRNATGGRHVYELFAAPADVQFSLTGAGARGARDETTMEGNALRYVVEAEGPGVYPYTLAVAGESLSAEKRGVLVRTDWSLTFFPSECDPRENPERWRLLADGPAAVRVEQPLLQLPFGWGGPADVISAADAAAQLPNDHFGLIARTELALPAGKWRVATRSDDGVRVRIDDEVVIENWTWHGPTVDAGTVELAAPQTVSIVVEYFELDGYALLEFSLEPMP